MALEIGPKSFGTYKIQAPDHGCFSNYLLRKIGTIRSLISSSFFLFSNQKITIIIKLIIMVMQVKSSGVVNFQLSLSLSLSPSPPLSHFQIVGNPNERDIAVSSYLLGLEYHVHDTSEWKLSLNHHMIPLTGLVRHRQCRYFTAVWLMSQRACVFVPVGTINPNRWRSVKTADSRAKHRYTHASK